MIRPLFLSALGAAILGSSPAFAWEVTSAPASGTHDIGIVGGKSAAAIVVDPADYPVVNLSANLLADDLQRVTGHRPFVTEKADAASQTVIAGTLGHSRLIDRLVASGKIKSLETVRGKWEATLCQIVEKPFPGVTRALVIVGSDRRGTSYGLMQLSEKIGVSPWYWWADVPAAHRNVVTVRIPSPESDSPGVRYRGIFINDEDWGMHVWAGKTFDPGFKNIGPKTYAKVFELMLRLRLNYLWPAMHGVTTEFAATPENITLAGKYGIVAGSSHCEPMLCNNVHWNQKTQGPWNYSLNQPAIHDYWESSAKTRKDEEAVWTLGIRGIHDASMQTPPGDMPGKLDLVGKVLKDQRALIDQNVTHAWGPVAQCFVPYKEVLPIYDAGLKVPDDVTLVWVDDNFGYIRRLSAPEERKRSGGSGVYWHLSYYGFPHSYTWINTTPPALIWEELHKAWQNEARNLWVLNVGDLKPAEIGIDYYARLAWKPDGFGPDAQQTPFLHTFAEQNFDRTLAQPIADLLGDFYRLGVVHKPELMDRKWALTLPADQAAALEHEYDLLLTNEDRINGSLPAAQRDAFTEMVGFPARVLASTGLIFLADRKAQRGEDAPANEARIAQLRSDLEAQVAHFNSGIAGGKWNGMMPGLVTGKNLSQWNSQVRWPWGEKPLTASLTRPVDPPVRAWLDAAAADRTLGTPGAKWTVVNGLGATGHAAALEPAGTGVAFAETDPNAPRLQWDFTTRPGGGIDGAEVWIDFLPTFRLYPGSKQRVAVSVDGKPLTVVEVPGSSGTEDERGAVRGAAVQNNYVRARVPLPQLALGKHILEIRAVDAGVVVDRVSLP